MKILQERCGVDCSSYVELLMGHDSGFQGGDDVSSNNTPNTEYVYELGATINLDAFEDIAHLERAASIPGLSLLPLQSWWRI